ncbi:tetratricopeptide repeat protein [Alloalcanivorax sp. C16-1]|uniref:tetratricopeptide repeat protein n=1 Tax=Alloalcanivorax sp. C16-1 TaxID=3390051 RepID=UPI003970A16C
MKGAILGSRPMEHLMIVDFKPLYLGVVLALGTPALAADPQHIQALNDEALSLHAAGRYDEAARHYRELLPLLDEHFGPNSLEVARIRASLGATQLARRQYREAAKTYRAVLDGLPEAGSPRLRADALNGLASALYMRRQYGKAEPLYQQAREILEAQPSVPREQLLLVLDNLSSLYRTLRRDSQAEQYRQQAQELRREREEAGEDAP